MLLNHNFEPHPEEKSKEGKGALGGKIAGGHFKSKAEKEFVAM